MSKLSIGAVLADKQKRTEANPPGFTGQKGLTPAPRPLYTIALEIRANWKKPYFGAVPYIDALMALNSIEENYRYDSAKEIVLYFLANANTWRGETARRVKAELNGLIGGKR